MNLSALSIGILTALLVMKLFDSSVLNDTLTLYAWYLLTFPFFYLFFALYSENYSELADEILLGSLLFVLVLFSFNLTSKVNAGLLTFAYLLFAIYDFSLIDFLTNPGVSNGWPEFSGAIHLLLSLHIVSLVNKRSEKPNAVNLFRP